MLSTSEEMFCYLKQIYTFWAASEFLLEVRMLSACFIVGYLRAGHWCSPRQTRHGQQHCDVTCRIPQDDRPQLILSAEAELGITAGLQDRVIQVSFWSISILALCTAVHELAVQTCATHI